MVELIANMHVHTPYSDGHGTHAQIAQAALKAGIDVVITSDHNVYVKGLDAYHQRGSQKVLLLTGEEIHDVSRQPQKNHLLVYGAGREMCTFAAQPQRLIDQVQQAGGVAFIAHPIDPALPAFHEDDLSWVDWDVKGYTGLELWNGFSELKTVVHNTLDGLFHVFFPQYIARGPLPATLAIWDGLLNQGLRVVAIGGADAHAQTMSLGPISRIVFPYEFHFRGVNTHILVPRGLSDSVYDDRNMLLDALRYGHAFVGYDLPASTRGFRFSASGRGVVAQMGDDISLDDGLTFQVRLPQPAECRLLRNGEVIKTWQDREILTHITNQRGVYRVECYINYLGRRRGWIFSNPIYVR